MPVYSTLNADVILCRAGCRIQRSCHLGNWNLSKMAMWLSADYHYEMSNKASEVIRRATPNQSTDNALRYVLDFGPTTPKKEMALKALEEWLANGSKYAGAILVRTPPTDTAFNDNSYVTAIELNVKLYTTSIGADDVITSFVRRTEVSGVQVSPSVAGRLVLEEDSRKMVSRVVRSALAYALGESGKDVVLSKLHLDYGFGFSEVTDFPARFMELLDEILQGGAKFVEERILQELEAEDSRLRGSDSFKDAMMRLAELDTIAGTQ